MKRKRYSTENYHQKRTTFAMSPQLDVLRADDPHLVPERLELALPVEGAGTGFDRDGARLDPGQHRDQLVTHHPTLEHDVAGTVDAMQLEDCLGNIDAEGLDVHDSSPSCCRLSACGPGGRAVHPISWRKQYGGLKVDQARRLKDLERENQRLRKAVADLTLDAMILKEAAKGNF